MSKEIYTQKHMTLSDRIFIEQALANPDSFKDIAAILKKPLIPSLRKSANIGFSRKAATTISKTTVPCSLPASIHAYVTENYAVFSANTAKSATARNIVLILRPIFAPN